MSKKYKLNSIVLTGTADRNSASLNFDSRKSLSDFIEDALGQPGDICVRLGDDDKIVVKEAGTLEMLSYMGANGDTIDRQICNLIKRCTEAQMELEKNKGIYECFASIFHKLFGYTPSGEQVQLDRTIEKLDDVIRQFNELSDGKNYSPGTKWVGLSERTLLSLQSITSDWQGVENAILGLIPRYKNKLMEIEDAHSHMNQTNVRKTYEDGRDIGLLARIKSIQFNSLKR